MHVHTFTHGCMYGEVQEALPAHTCVCPDVHIHTTSRQNVLYTCTQLPHIHMGSQSTHVNTYNALDTCVYTPGLHEPHTHACTHTYTCNACHKRYIHTYMHKHIHRLYCSAHTTHLLLSTTSQHSISKSTHTPQLDLQTSLPQSASAPRAL
jgi:hypothetical protein